MIKTNAGSPAYDLCKTVAKVVKKESLCSVLSVSNPEW